MTLRKAFGDAGNASLFAVRSHVVAGSWHRHRRPIGISMKSKKALAHHRALAVTTNIVPA